MFYRIKKLFSKKWFLLSASISVTTLALFACGTGSYIVDLGTPTTMVTSANGQSATLGKGKQFINPVITYLGGLNTLSQAATPWTNTSTNIITLSQIPYVEGGKTATDYSPAGSVFSMTTNPTAPSPLGDINHPGTRSFSGNGLPNTMMGTFPVQPGTAAYPYYNVLPGGTFQGVTVTADGIGIGPYDITSTVPLNPVATGFYPINSLIVGVTLTGAVWHIEYANDASSNWYSPINALPTDQCFGHPYGDKGQYHLHGYSWKCFPNQGTSGQSPVFGFALDGFPITGPRAADGHMMTNAELDECHGTTSEITMPDGTLKTTYHYVLNREYPYSVGCFRGKVNYAKALGSVDMQEVDAAQSPYLDAPYPP